MWASASLTVHGSLVSGRGTWRRQSAGLSPLTNRSSCRNSRCVRSVTSLRVCLIEPWPSRDLADGLGEHLDSFVELGLLDQDRGKEPDHGAAAGQYEHAALLHRLDDWSRRLLQFDSQHQSPPADLADLRESQS